jgi:hypothetical protein
MHSDPEQNALRDILRQIDLAQNFAQGQDRDAFSADIMRVYAVTRCLEIISEASRRLSEGLKARHSGIAWREMRPGRARDPGTPDVQRASELADLRLPLRPEMEAPGLRRGRPRRQGLPRTRRTCAAPPPPRGQVLDEARNHRGPALVNVVISQGSARKPQQFRWHS